VSSGVEHETPETEPGVILNEGNIYSGVTGAEVYQLTERLQASDHTPWLLGREGGLCSTHH